MNETTATIQSIAMQRLDVLTLYCNCGTREKPQIVQVEVQVTKHGDIKVFCDEQVQVLPFGEWSAAG